MGIEERNQVCVMIHSGSRGLGHQVATDALVEMEKAMKRDNIRVNDRQLACARIKSPEGEDYLKAMSAAANYAWVNRSSMTFLTRQVKIISNVWSQANSTPTLFPSLLSLPVSPFLSSSLSSLAAGVCQGIQVHPR